MDEMGTVRQNFDSPVYDKHLEHSRRQQAERTDKTVKHRKVDFEPPQIKARCFIGREEMNYENL